QIDVRDGVSGNDTADGGADTDVCSADQGDTVIACERLAEGGWRAACPPAPAHREGLEAVFVLLERPGPGRAGAVAYGSVVPGMTGVPGGARPPLVARRHRE